MNHSKFKPFQLGYFLNIKYIEKAILLIEEQIKNEKPVYKTLNFEYFSQNKENIIFETEILNNFFYGLKSKYFIYPYKVGKGVIGYRPFNFISYGMLVVYYAIGLYIRHLVSSIYEEKRRIEGNIHSFYGTHIFDDFFENNQSKVANIYYLEGIGSYKNFLNILESSVQVGDYVIELDIKDYFSSINLDILLEFINHSTIPSRKKELNVDNNSIDSIKLFLTHIINQGIIQSDNNIVSSFLGDLYLTKLDFFLHKYLTDILGPDGFIVLRYIDDIKIIIKNLPTRQVDLFLLIKEIEDFLQKECELSLNSDKIHSELYSKQEDINELLFKTMPSNADEGDVELNISLDEVDEKIDKIITSLEAIAATNIIDFKKISSKDILNIKSVFKDSRILSKMRSPQYKEKLLILFRAFNFEFILFYYKGFHALISINEESLIIYLDYYLSKDELKFYELKAVEHILYQKSKIENTIIEEKKKILFQKLKDSFPAIGYSNDHLSNFYLKYINRIEVCEKFIEQVKFRNIAEKNKDFNSALNHLLNEIQQLIFNFDKSSDKNDTDYKSDNCLKYLYSINVEIDLILVLKNLFDRRNNNPISHSGLNGEIAWGISISEYEDYKRNILNLEECVLSLK